MKLIFFLFLRIYNFFLELREGGFEPCCLNKKIIHQSINQILDVIYKPF